MATPGADTIAEAAQAFTQPDGSDIQAIDVAGVAQLAESHACSRRQVEIAALEAGIVPLRYARNFRSYAPADQITLLKATVAVIGLGGLGGAVCEALARVGVGRLILVDGDRFDDHNLNRQALCTETGLGTAKAAAAARRVAALNGATETIAHDAFLSADNAEAILAGAQVAVDCLDNIPGRFVLERAARTLGIPLVSAAVGGEAGHLMVIFPQDAGLAQIYGPPDNHRREKGAETALGNLPHIVTLMANLEVCEILKILLGRPTELRGRMLLVDLAGSLFERVDLTG